MNHRRASPQANPPGVAKDNPAPKAGPKRKAGLLAAPESKTAPSALKRKKPWKLSYLSVYRASPLERISLIKRGVPASEVKHLFVDLRIGQGVGFKALALSTATVNKKARMGAVLSNEESERVIGFAKLVGQLEAMIEESGDHTGFDSRAWMARWLTEPLPAFGGARPVDLIDTMEGQGLVSSALAKLQSGAYA
jgi:putative toxin-antitoxin system antitoxin component (TIGR02293 family)